MRRINVIKMVNELIKNGTVNMSEIARRLGVSKQAVSKQVKELEASEIIKRRPDGGFELTKKGKVWLHLANPMSDFYRDEEFEAYIRNLDEWINSLLTTKGRDALSEVEVVQRARYVCSAFAYFLLWLLAKILEATIGIERVDDVGKVMRLLEKRLSAALDKYMKPLLSRMAMILLALRSCEWKLAEHMYYIFYQLNALLCHLNVDYVKLCEQKFAKP